MAGIPPRKLGHLAYFELRVEGTRLREDFLRHIRNVAVLSTVDGCDELSFTVDEVVTNADGTTSPGRPDILTSKAFGEGNQIEVWATGAEDIPLACLGRFELQMAAPRCGPSGRSLEVIGLDASNRLLGYKAPRVYGKDVLDHQIVLELAEEYGFTPNVDTNTLPRGKGRVKKAGATDFEFMNDLADTARNRETAEYRWFVRFDPKARGGRGADVLTFEPFQIPGQQTKRFTFRYEAQQADDFNWASTLRSAAVDPSLKSMPTKLSVVYLDSTTGETQEVIVEVSDPASAPDVVYTGGAGKSPAEKEIKDGAAIQLKAFGEQDERQGGLTFPTQGDAIGYALLYFRRRQYAFAMISGRIIGVETVRIWDVHDLKGIHPRWDGPVLMTEVKHVFNSGDLAYAIEFQGQRLPSSNSAPKLS